MSDARGTVLIAELRGMADAAQASIEPAALSEPLRRFADTVLAGVRRGPGYREALDVLDAAAGELSRFQDAVRALRGALAEGQDRRTRIEPFGPDWKNAVTAEVTPPGDEATSRWVRRYAEAFTARRFDICRWLCGGTTAKAYQARPLLADRDRDLSRRLLLAARAAEKGDLAATLPALATLTESGWAAGLPAELSASLWCMRARVVARESGDPAQGRDWARAALRRARAAGAAVPVTVLASLHAAVGECLLAIDDRAGAAGEADRALELAPAGPAGIVLRGLVAEAAGDFASADEAYEEAADVAGRLPADLFAPTPPNLLWSCGRRLRSTDPRRAARIIRDALSAGIHGAGRYPERKAYVDLARTLESRRQGATGAADRRLAARAAEAYWEAGRRYAWAGDEISAVGYLSQAAALEDGNFRYAFEVAEARRIWAVREDGTVDVALVNTAAEWWRKAYALGVPGRRLPWAYVTMALIEHEQSGDLYRPRASWPAVALLERGLLCDPGNARLMAQLSLAHRLVGARRTAADLTEAAARLDGDELIFDQRLLALVESERAADALSLIGAHGLKPDQPWLVIRQVQLLITLDRPGEALAVLRDEHPADQALRAYYTGLCQELLGHQEDARRSYEELAAGAGSAGPDGRADLSAWGNYLLGRPGEARPAYAELVRRDPEDPALRCELGQILMADGDLDAGRRELTAGIAATTSLWGLTMLRNIEVPRLARHLGDGAAARSALEEIDVALEARERVLRLGADARSELEGLCTPEASAEQSRGVRLAQARLDLAAGEHTAALERYAELAAEVPEAAEGVRAAAGQVCAEADGLARGDAADAARTAYVRLLDVLDRLPEPPPDMAAAAHLRVALLELDRGRDAAFRDHVVHAFPPGRPADPAPAVGAVLATVLDDPDRYWAVVDAAARIGPPAAGLRTALEPAKLLRTGRDEIGSAAVFPLATPLALRLGPGLLSRASGGANPRPLVEQARRRIEQETGAMVPGIALHPLPDGAEPGGYTIELAEDEVARGTVPVGGVFRADPGGIATDPLTCMPGRWAGDGEGRTPAEFVVSHLEAVIRAHLPRLFSVDDVALWLASCRRQGDLRPGADRLSVADRLELLRLLRLLLREQVPIVDAAAILQVVQEAPLEWSALDLLPAVRARIGPRLVPGAVRRERPLRLPPELEEAFAAGFSPAHPDRWQMPRPAAAALTRRIAAWLAAERPAGAVVVRDAALRPYLWRLIAGLVPGPVWVLSEGETDDA